MWSENTRRRLKRINTWDNKEFLSSNFSHQTQFQVAQKTPSKINAPSPNQFSLVPQSCPTLCHPMDCSTPSLPVHHQHPELAQIHVHWVSDAIQPSHPLLSPSPPAFNHFQHQDLFQWIGSSHQVAKVLELQLQHQLQHQSFQWIFRAHFL